MFKKKKWFEDKCEDDFFLRKKNNKHIVALKKRVSGRVIIFCRKFFSWELAIYFYIVNLKFCPYLNVGCKVIFEQKKSGPNKRSPLNSSI